MPAWQRSVEREGGVMGDLRGETIIRERRCWRCRRPFDLGETVYVPGRYEAWTADGPVCGDCADALEAEAVRRMEKERGAV
jgi:hypothetical protein